MRALCSTLVLAAALSGCAAFAGRGDYLDYRDVRLAKDEPSRFIAMQRYVSRHPDGRWYGSIQHARAQNDRALFERGKSTRAGLELYLAAYPDGTYADQARSRLSAVAAIEQRKRAEDARAAELVQARKQREAELSRTWVSRFFGYWIKTLVALEGWGQPIDQVARNNADFSRAFGRPPRPRCTADECVKYYESSYAVPVPGGTRLERSVRMVLRLRMDRGKVVRAEVLLPERGFSRWREIEERKPVVDADPESRQQAVEWAVGQVLHALDGVAHDRTELSGYTLAAIPAPAIGPTGELVDTTAEDPSAPQNRIQGEVAAPSEPAVGDMLKPQAPDQAPDMEMAPLRVGPDGRPLSEVPQPKAPPAAVTPAPAAGAPAGETMEMAPLAVPAAPGAGGAPAAPAPATAPATSVAPAPAEAPAIASAPALTRAFLVRPDLRVVVFAASSDAPSPAYDGFAIERVEGAKARAKPAAAPKPKPAPAAAPAAAPAPAAP
jgi:hypothetical protein